MQLFDALQQLLDLPRTFKRDDLTFLQVMASIASALSLLTSANKGDMVETTYNGASAGWIDVWADLAGVARRVGEGDGVMHARLPNMLLAWRDSAVAIEEWLKVVEHINGTVTENIGSTGYTVTLPATLTRQRLIEIINELAWVRPAGVPFNYIATTGGTYLTTVDYFSVAIATLGVEPPYEAVDIEADEPDEGSIQVTGDIVHGGRVTGSYLALTNAALGIGPRAGTDNQKSLLPDLLLTDPTLNPGV